MLQTVIPSLLIGELSTTKTSLCPFCGAHLPQFVHGFSNMLLKTYDLFILLLTVLFVDFLFSLSVFLLHVEYSLFLLAFVTALFCLFLCFVFISDSPIIPPSTPSIYYHVHRSGAYSATNPSDVPSAPTRLQALLVSYRFVTLTWADPERIGPSEIIAYMIKWQEVGSER